MKKLLYIALSVLFIIILIPGCSKKIKPGDLIIKVDKEKLTKVSETDILSYFEKNKVDFTVVSEYMLNNEKVFGTRPVILNKVTGFDKIQDNAIKKLADTLLQDGFIKGISSLNDEIKDVRFHIDNKYGVFDQGIRYVSDKKIVYEDKTEYNYVKDYKDLGHGWFYYIYYYDDIKEADIFRKKAWDSISEQEKKTIIYDWNKAVVQLKDVDKADKKTGKTKERRLVAAVTFNTDRDGLLGPITLYLDPVSKEVVGGAPRL